MLLLAIACTEEIDVADYDLQLLPVFPTNQEPLEYAQDIRITLEQDGEAVAEARLSEVPASGSASSASGLPALDETVVWVEALGASSVTAWGRTGPLTAANGGVEEEVFMAKSSAFAHLAGVEEALGANAMIALGDGRFLLAGGFTTGAGGLAKGDDGLYALDLVNVDALPAFVRIGDLPVWEDEYTDRVGATFTVFSEAGTGNPIGMLAGGASGWLTSGAMAGLDDTYTVNLYDIGSGTWDIEPLSNGQMLSAPRFGHEAVLNTANQIVVAGGWQFERDGDIATIDLVEVFNPNEQDFYAADNTPNDVGTFGLALAPLADDGAIICGGGLIDLAVTPATWEAQKGCVRVATTRELKTDVADLEQATVAPAVVTVDDDHVLVIGGAITDADGGLIGNDPGQAIETVQAYDRLTDTWTLHPGALVYARAGARAVLVAPNKVLIFGGAAEYDPISGSAGMLACAELLDTETFVSEALSACTDSAEVGDLPSASAHPAFAWDPEFGVVTAGGYGITSQGYQEPSSMAALYLVARQP